jgi:hypothetical protein
MEEDIYRTSEKSINESDKRIKQRLQNAIEVGEEKQKYELAHNPEMNNALSIVKNFIIKKKRVCYGGTAMNAILPKEKRFYNPDVDLPDYDFFTPDITSDVHDLVKELTRSGFKDVHHRIGIHKGTSKVLVNFVAIADVTSISNEVYNIFLSRSVKKEGMHYTDPDILRMMMYLEISRPKGMLSRWDKVFERLQLINSVFPPKATAKKHTTYKKKQTVTVSKALRTAVYDYCIENHKILLTGDLDKYYSIVIKKETPNFNLDEATEPIGFISAEIKLDAKKLQNLLGGPEKCKLVLHKSRGEIVTEHVEIRVDGKPIVFILEEAGCHAYLNFPLKDGRSIAIASLDTLITIYYSISIFTKKLKELIPGINSKIAHFIGLVEENRKYKNPNIPSFPMSCSGYQKGFATLLREKAQRIKKAREDIKLL